MMQIVTVGAAIAAVTAQIAVVSALVAPIAAKVLAVVARLTVAPIRAVVAKLAPIAAPIPIVGADVAAVTAEVATVAAEIAPIGADVAGIATDIAGSLWAGDGRKARLRVRDRHRTASKRHREPECNQFIAKHLEILQRSVGTRPFIAPFEEVDEAEWRVLRDSPYLAFREKDGIVPRRAGPTRFNGPSSLRLKGLRTIRGRSDSFADSE